MGSVHVFFGCKPANSGMQIQASADCRQYQSATTGAVALEPPVPLGTEPPVPLGTEPPLAALGTPPVPRPPAVGSSASDPQPSRAMHARAKRLRKARSIFTREAGPDLAEQSISFASTAFTVAHGWGPLLSALMAPKRRAHPHTTSWPRTRVAIVGWRKLIVPLFSLLSAACSPDAVTVPLQAYSDGELALSLSDNADGDSRELLRFRLSLGAKGCPRLSEEVTAHLNGMLMKMHARGGPQEGPTSACDRAEFTLDIPYDAVASQQDARLELSDNTHRIVVVVRHLVAARSLTPRQPLSPLSRGQTLVFDWSPAIDTLENLQIFFNPGVNNSRKLSVKRTGVVVESDCSGGRSRRPDASAAQRSPRCEG